VIFLLCVCQQEHQVQSVWKTLCDVGGSNLAQLTRKTTNGMSLAPTVTRNPTKVRTPPQPPVSAAMEDSYRELVCSALACLGRW
jgi:hypothetical protein